MAVNKDNSTHRVPRLHAALLRVSDDMTETEVEKSKFLCHGKIAKSKLETVKNGFQLFNILIEHEVIRDTDHTFVIKLLESIRRDDLKKSFQLEMMPEENDQQTPPRDSASSYPHTQQGVLKTPAQFGKVSQEAPASTPSRTGIFEGIPKPARSISEDPSSSFNPQSMIKPGVLKTKQASMKTSQSFPGSSSLGDVPASGPLNPNAFSHDKPAGQKDFSDRPISGSSELKGNIVGRMDALSLQGSPQIKRATEEEVETDSPSLMQEEQKQSSRSGGSVSDTKSSVSPLRNREVTSSPLVDLSSDSPGNSRQVMRQVGQGTRSSSDQSYSASSRPLLDLPNPSGGASGLLASSGRQGGPQSPLNLSRNPTPQRQTPQMQGQQPPKMKPEEQVHHIDRMMTQQQDREEARAAANEHRPILRKYQLELAERPLHQFENHIICAPTGSGKTLTAAYISHEYWEFFKRNKNPKFFKALFIVNMRHLTSQQRDAFKQYFTNKMAVRTIGDQQRFTDALKLDEAMPAVLMLTAQIFVNSLKSKEIDISDLDMIIFDECHHTDLKHPYNEIMKIYLKKKQTMPLGQRVGVSGESLPFIIGLSASLGVGSDALNHLLTLCGNMDAKGVVRVLENEDELQRYVKTPEQDSIKEVSRRPAEDRRFGLLLEDLMSQIEQQLPEIGEKPLPSPGTQPYENESRRRLGEAQKTGDRTAIIVYMYLYEYNRALMLYDDLRVKDGLEHLIGFHDKRVNDEHVPVEEEIRQLFTTSLRQMNRMSRDEDQHSNEKLAQLAHLLQVLFMKKTESKGIVLVRTKVATTAISDFIRRSTVVDALPCRVFPMRFVGQGDFEDGCLTEAEQKAVLQSFRDVDGCNVLVATDIAQEGLDMPACNFVIRYNFVSNEIGTVQSKGRARAEGSKCFLIVERDSANQRRELENRHKVRKMIEAMEELEAMTEDERLQKITDRQIEIMEKIRKAEEEANRAQAMYNLDRITIHCKECSALVCTASELRRKGTAGHVTCISRYFGEWVREKKYRIAQRYRDTETVGLVFCGTEDCGNQFGTMQKFLNLNPPEGYALKADKFKIHFERGGAKTPKKWNKAGFEIIQASS